MKWWPGGMRRGRLRPVWSPPGRFRGQRRCPPPLRRRLRRRMRSLQSKRRSLTYTGRLIPIPCWTMCRSIRRLWPGAGIRFKSMRRGWMMRGLPFGLPWASRSLPSTCRSRFCCSGSPGRDTGGFWLWPRIRLRCICTPLPTSAAPASTQGRLPNVTVGSWR